MFVLLLTIVFDIHRGRAMREDWTTLNPGLIVDSMMESMKPSVSSNTDRSILDPLESIGKFMKRVSVFFIF